MPPISADESKPLRMATEPEVQNDFKVEEAGCINKLEKPLPSEEMDEITSAVLALKMLHNSKAPINKKKQVKRLDCGQHKKILTIDVRNIKKGTYKPPMVTDALNQFIAGLCKIAVKNSQRTSQNFALVFKSLHS